MAHGSAFDIVVTKLGVRAPRCEARLRRAVETALRRHHARSSRVCLTLVDDVQIARLNKLYLGRKGPTDVLSFDLRDEFETQEESAKRAPRNAREWNGHADGEIIVSVDTARREAEMRGQSVTAELTLYALHGTLHLLGYNDRRKSEAALMHEVEDEILSAIGLGPVFRADRADAARAKHKGRAD